LVEPSIEEDLSRMIQDKLWLLLAPLGLTFALTACGPKATSIAEAAPTPVPRSPTPTPAAKSSPERSFDVPPISHPLTATLGGKVELLGYDLSAETIARPWYNARRWSSGLPTFTLTLYWRALTEMDESYTVFVHLLAPDGSMTGRRDSPPAEGTCPTNLWLAGEVVTDVHRVPVRLDAIPAAHWLEVGMYVAETGDWLPVAGVPDDAVLLQTITVTE
jgi:hypothetical protein